MIKVRNSKNLLIALEPEAASIFCRSLDLSPFEDSKSDGVRFKSGQKLLVIDAGGIQHRIDEFNKLHSIATNGLY